MKLKGLIIALCMVLLCGCQSSKSEGGLDMYKGKNGKETYEAAVKYFNKTVKYYRSEQTVGSGNSMSVNIDEYGVASKGIISLSFNNSTIGSYPSFITTAIKDGQKVMASSGINSNILKVTTSEYEKIENIYLDTTKFKGVTIKDVERIDEKDKITLNMKLVDDGTSKTNYYLKKIEINNEGLISSEQNIYYTDSSFSKVEIEVPAKFYVDINKVTGEVFTKTHETYLEAIKACDGLTIDEGVNKLKYLL